MTEEEFPEVGSELEWQQYLNAGHDRVKRSEFVCEYLKTRGSNRKRRLYATACIRWGAARAFRCTEIDEALELSEAVADEHIAAGVLERKRVWVREMLREIGREDLESDLYQPLSMFAPLMGIDLSLAVSVCAYSQSGYRDSFYKPFRLFREVLGNPFRPVAFDPRWRTSDVVGLARAIYDDKAFERMPILADALMDAGCEDEQVISHCRGDGPHVRGCWVVDLVLGKE